MQIHQSHQPYASRNFKTIILLALIFIIILIWQPPEYAYTVANYLPLHIFLEGISIIMAAHIFATIANTYKRGLSQNTALLGLLFLGVALLDFSHTMSYKGMPDFISPSDPEKAINFWLIARSLSAIAMLCIAILPWHKNFNHKEFKILLSLVLIIVIVTNIVILYFPYYLPHTYTVEYGLSRFKLIYEYILITIYITSAIFIFRYFKHIKIFNTSGFFTAACLFALGEAFFALYTDVADIYNLSGHIYKLIATYFLYKATFVEAIKQPYVLLEQSREKLKATLNALPDLAFEMDDNGYYLSIHTNTPMDLSSDYGDIIGKTPFDVMPHDQAEICMSAIDEARNKGLSRGKTINIKTIEGIETVFELSVSSTINSKNERSFIVISRNITQRVREVEQLYKLSQAIEQNPAAIFIYSPDLRVEYVNRTITKITGYTPAELKDKEPVFLHSKNNPKSLVKTIFNQINNKQPWSGEVNCLKKGGEEYTASVFIYPIYNTHGDIINFLSIHDDVTENKELTKKLKLISNYDQLTGLPNRNQLIKLFRYISNNYKKIIVLWLDLDSFQNINDAYGRHTGDIVIQEMANRLSNIIRPIDILSRPIGDEFIIIMPNISEENVVTYAQKILIHIRKPLTVYNNEIGITASIGISVYPINSNDHQTIIQQADTAMHRSKQQGRGGFSFYKATMQEETAHKLAMRTALARALKNDELKLEYQPQISLTTGKITGAEVLLRWHSEQWGNVSPAQFIPMAEETGIIIKIGTWVLKKATRQMAEWVKQGFQIETIAVNISAAQFEQTNFTSQIINILNESELPSKYLELELTEAVAMKNHETAAHQMQQLSDANIKISIDDFGTGYSSLSYLNKFNINTLKIDQSFIRDITEKPDKQAIVTAIIEMAHSLGITTIAEGVETQQHLDFIRAKKCDSVQGFFYSKPLSGTEFELFIKSGLNQ